MDVTQTQPEEYGPNDIVIHLVNPYKCLDCGTEFFQRGIFLQHLSEHMDKMKLLNPCFQIVCGVSMAEQQAGGITVTRDILQINEQQMFELQDPTMDYSQVGPLKTLERAGILSLPPPLKKVKKEAVNESSAVKKTGRTVSLLPERDKQPEQQLHVQVINAQEEVPGSAQPAQITLSEIQRPVGEANMSEIDALVQHAFLADGEYSIMIETEAPGAKEREGQAGAYSSSNQGFEIIDFDHMHMGEKSAPGKKKLTGQRSLKSGSVACPVCFRSFANSSVLERHKVVHTGEKPHTCNTCFKSFNDVSSLRKHTFIHKRQHSCRICHRTYLRKSQLDMHMKQHIKKRYIQFGNTHHEVKVVATRNKDGQMIQEFTLLTLLGDESEDAAKTDGKDATSVDNATSTGAEKENTEENKIHEVGSDGSDAKKIETNENKVYEGLDMDAQSGETTQVSEDVVEMVVDPAHKNKQLIYKCGHCKQLIYTRPTLSRHLIKHTDEKPFRCEKCHKQFRDRSDLMHHYKTHSKPVKCTSCNASFSKALYLQNHKERGCPFIENDSRFTVLADMSFQCNQCSKILKSKANVQRHLLVHAFDDRAKTNDKTDAVGNGENVSLKIDGGDISEKNVEDFIEPLENSVGFLCTICCAEFRFKSFIITHIRMHLNQRPFTCRDCGKSFYSKNMLKKHIQNHTRPYQCPLCNKTFIRRYLMTHHFNKKHKMDEEEKMEEITVLHDEKLLQCDICGKTMKLFQKSLMQNHIRLHKDVRPFPCPTCKKSFSSEIALKKHSLNHSKPYVCPQCSRGFSRRYLLTEHYKTSCGRKKGRVQLAPSTQENLVKAVASAGTQEDPMLVKPDVNEEYRPEVVTVLNTSTGKEVYTCVPCNKVFTEESKLMRHLKTFQTVSRCPHCRDEFQDKHLRITHQRSCLGPSVIVKSTVSTSEKKTQVVGEKQEKIQKIMKKIREEIKVISSSPALENSQGDNVMEAEQNENSDTGAKSGDQDTESSPLRTSVKVGSKSTPTNVVLSRTKEIIKREEGKYPCPECKKLFTTPRGLKIHASYHVRFFKCDLCGEDFTQLSDLRTHSAKHAAGDSSSQSLPEEETEQQEGNGKEKTVAAGGIQGGQATPKAKSPRRKLEDKNVTVSEDEEEDKLAEMQLEHKVIEVTQKLMQSGTRGRPYSCPHCRRRFTEEDGLENHLKLIHGSASSTS